MISIRFVISALMLAMLYGCVSDPAYTGSSTKESGHSSTAPGTGEAIRASHILLESEEQGEFIISLLRKGEDFASVARKYSIGPSARNGGDLGYFTHEVMVSEFSDAAFALRVGEFSKRPVRSQFGWHVIKVFDRKPGKDDKTTEI